MRTVVCMLIMVAIAAAALPAAAQSRRGEMRGAWMGSGYGRDWPAITKSLKDNGFNALFPNMSTGGVAWYPSKVLPVAAGAVAGRDELAEAVKAAKQQGIELHVWRINWMTEGIPKDVLAKWEAEGRLMRDATGRLVRDDPSDPLKMDWLCPSNPANRKLEKDAMLEVARKYDIAGIQFDYMRFPSPKYCYCDHCRDQFQQDTAAKVRSWPEDVLAEGRYAKLYETWRQGLQTSLVQEISREAHRLKPALKVSLAAWPEAEVARRSALQDWPAWVKSGALDFICFMVYSNDPDRVAKWLSAEEDIIGGSIPVYAGLGAFQMKQPATLVQQVRASREAGADGFVAFAYYSGDFHTWLPSLHSSVTLAAADPMPHWSPPASFDISGPAALPSLRGRQVKAGEELTVDVKLGNAPAEGASSEESEGAAQAAAILRRATDTRQPVMAPEVMPANPSGGSAYQLAGRIVVEDPQGAPIAVLGGFDGDRQFARPLTFTAPQGPFRIAVYGSEKREGDRQPREFVTRSPLLVGVTEQAQPTPQSQAPPPPAAAETLHAQLAQLFDQAQQRATPEDLGDARALILVHATGEGGGDWWLRVAEGKCTTGEGVVDKPDLLVSGAAEDLLAVATHQADPMELWTAGRIGAIGNVGLVQQLFSALGIGSIL